MNRSSVSRHRSSHAQRELFSVSRTSCQSATFTQTSLHPLHLRLCPSADSACPVTVVPVGAGSSASRRSSKHCRFVRTACCSLTRRLQKLCFTRPNAPGSIVAREEAHHPDSLLQRARFSGGHAPRIAARSS